ncbi:hypothetical protein FF1_011368 [Malus domestica]
MLRKSSREIGEQSRKLTETESESCLHVEEVEIFLGVWNKMKVVCESIKEEERGIVLHAMVGYAWLGCDVLGFYGFGLSSIL